MPSFDAVKQYLLDLELPVIEEDAGEEIVVVRDEEAGISRLVIDCEEPLLILEQRVMSVPAEPGSLFKRLLQMNRTLVHGASCSTRRARRSSSATPCSSGRSTGANSRAR